MGLPRSLVPVCDWLTLCHSHFGIQPDSRQVNSLPYNARRGAPPRRPSQGLRSCRSLMMMMMMNGSSRPRLRADAISTALSFPTRARVSTVTQYVASSGDHTLLMY